MSDRKTPRQATETTELRHKIQSILRYLPPIEYQPRVNEELDYYGARFCISDMLGLPRPLFGRATWLHGWGWFEPNEPEQLAEAQYKGVNNLVRSKAHEAFLKANGYTRAIAVGVPFLYPDTVEVPRIPDSLLVFPMHTTQCTDLTFHEETHPYIEYIKQIRDQFSLVVVCIGCEDVRRGNWITAVEKAGIPWITGAWTYDRHGLVRMQSIMRQFEFATTNSSGSHVAYAAYCGCKVSFDGPKNDLTLVEVDTHPFYRHHPEVARQMKKRDFNAEFKEAFPFFFVAPREATARVAWAFQALGGNNKKQPEEIAELFEWKLRKLPSGRWAPINPHDVLTNNELFAKAVAKSLMGQHDAAFKLTNILKCRHVHLRDVEILRARYFLNIGNTHGAREALKEELRHYPDNAQAAAMFQALGGDTLTPHVAKSEDEKEFIAFYNMVRPFTRLNIKRAKSLYTLAVRVCQENLPGNFVECGVAAGGSTMMLALVVQKHSRIARKVFSFDTFTGMPDPGEDDTTNGVPADDTGWGAGTSAAPEGFVRAQCQRLGVGAIVETRKGLFEDTLPVHRGEIGEIALLHMDADWYSSTMTILDNLFDHLHDNALIQIDDYGTWDGCKKAILDYSTRHDLFFDVQEIDGTGVWCAKPVQVGKKPAARPAVPPRDPAFLDPQPTPEFMDLYLVRKGILARLTQAIPIFRGTLLDVGCGQMPYREHILAQNPQITRYIGLDFATGKYADRRQPDLAWDGVTIPLPDGGADCAMVTEVLEHCPDPVSVLREIRRVLVPGGSLFFTTPFLWPVHDAPHDHYRYTPYALRRLLEEAGFTDVRVEALGGWNASLAQMLGLWLRRAPMDAESRDRLTRDLHPFFTELVRTDVVPTDFSKNPMVTCLSGTARAAAPRIVKTPDAAGPG